MPRRRPTIFGSNRRIDCCSTPPSAELVGCIFGLGLILTGMAAAILPAIPLHYTAGLLAWRVNIILISFTAGYLLYCLKVREPMVYPLLILGVLWFAFGFCVWVIRS